MKSNLLKYEKELYKNNICLIAGVDEAGRGPLVGPVVAGAVILPKNYHLEGLNDSKQLSEKKREEYFEILKKDAISIGVGIVSAKEIDEINILEASRKAMYIAINNLDITPEYILSDAMSLNDIDIPSKPIIHGDALSLSIAAASVVAKVTRDHLMYEMDKLHPEYNLKKHKGYPTKEHLELIKKYGVFDEYRMSYKPVKKIIEELGNNEENKEIVAI
ncbi:MAG: ribonuclease HII [Ruminococcus sp.]|nr:ribonuclease HII [Ruminococcus sp.]